MNDGTRQRMGSTGNAPDDSLNQRPATDREESAMRLFLSYAGVDRAYARTVAEALEATHGVKLFWDKKDLGWGDNWQKELEQALLDCNAFLLLVSSGGVRNWTLAETRVALSRHFGAKEDCERLLILPLLLPKAEQDLLPPFLRSFQTETWPAEYPPEDAQAFARWLLPRLRGRLKDRRIGPELPRIELKEGQSPFRGLASYREEDAPFFFGRQVETVELLHRLGRIEGGRRRRWLQIEGESGSGKSSLIHAGLLPAIREGWRGFNDGVIADCVILEPMRPGKDVLRELATALYRVPGNTLPSKAIKDALHADDDEVLAHYLRDLRPSQSYALLLVVDQFEELLTVAENRDDVGCFDRQLAAALEDEGTGLYLITGVRSDLLNFDGLPRLQNCLNNLGTRYQLNRVNEQQLREILFDLPAALGLEWSDRELPKEILALALKEPAPLPTVQFILDHLWREGDHRHLERRLFDPRHSDSLGQKLGQAAEELLNSLDGNRDHALNLLLQLTVRQGEGYARRSLDYATAVEAAGGGAEGERVILRLSGQRDKDDENKVNLRLLTVTPGATDAEKSVELIHEILLRERLPPKDAPARDASREGVWPTLWNYLELNRKRYHDRELLRLRVERWSQTRGWRGLASRSELRDFRRVAPDDKEQTARYLSRSRWRHRLTEGGAAIMLILAAWIMDAALWINEHRFPTDYMPVRMMSWLGVIPKPDLVQIEPGTVRIGSETGNPDEQSVRELTIANGFRIGRHEVTFYQYDFYAAALGKPLPRDGDFGRSSRPVIYVNWHEAVDYAEWLSGQIGASCRLPGEDEWEYAARAGGSGEYGLGQGGVEITRDNLGDYAWYMENSGDQTHPVGEKKKPNDWGLYDMFGNVWEWSRDFYDRDKDSYVLRGGSWDSLPDYLRAAIRFWNPPVTRNVRIGFRVVCVPHS